MCHQGVNGAGASMRFEKRHDEGSSGVARLHVDSKLAGMLDRWQQQCQLISTACRLRGGAGVIGVQRAQASAANCWLLRGQGKREHGRQDTYELELELKRLPFSRPGARRDARSSRAPASLAVVRCDAGKRWVRW
jgi:hypothetical protein